MRKGLLLASFFLLFTFIASAQDKIRISGNVQDEQKQALGGATVVIKGTTIGTTTDDAGNYTIEVPKDAKTIVFSYVGIDPKEYPIDTKQGNYVLNVDLVNEGIGLNQIIVSASKKSEKVLDAPASVSVIGAEKLERNVVTTPIEQLKTTPGVDVMRTGLVSSNVVVRGFNNIFSGSVLNVVDNRIGSVPSLRVNAYQLTPTSNLDYERIEVVRGPASALYGPNASAGVVHIITKDPLMQKKKFETTIAFTSGFTVLDTSLQQLPIGRYGNEYFTGNPNPDSIAGYAKKRVLSGNIINPEFRHSGKLWDGKFGYKISGSYFQAVDYPNFDSREPYDGDSLLFGSAARGQVFIPDSVNGQPSIQRFQKDFRIRKFTADARFDIKPIEDITITVNGGLAGARNVELTGLGAAAAGGPTGSWIYWYLQTRFKWKNLFVQYFINSSDAGNTFLIPQLSPSARNDYNSSSPPAAYQVQKLIDKSKLHVVQVQHSYSPIKSLNFIYGVDVLMTRPDTRGTINGRFEERDNLTQAGGYLQGEYDPFKWLKLLAAIRVDYNSIIKNVAASPRAAVVFKPATGHNIRVTYNRAFDSPNTLNQFLDLSNGLIPNGINVRGIGNPYGWNYKYDDATGMVQFKTAPWTAPEGQWVTYGNKSINTQMFDSITKYVKGIFVSSGQNPIVANSIVNNIFNGIQGNGTVVSADQIAVDYANLAQKVSFDTLSASSFQNLKRINNSFTQTLELGYKGLIASKLSVQLDLYWTRISQYVSALRSASGAVMLDHETYLGGGSYDANGNFAIDTNGLLYKNLYSGGGALNSILLSSLDGVGALQNSTIVPSIPGSVWDELIVLSYNFPMGTITPNDDELVNSDYILTYKNLGRLDVFGLDLGLQYNAYEDDRHSVTVGGTLSWVNKDQLTLSSGENVPLNAPKLKASATFDHLLKKIGIGYGLSFRYQMGYFAESSVYSGEVKPAYLPDLRLSYRPNFYKGLLLSINVNNFVNYQWRSFPGTPLMGAQFFARAQVTF